MARRPKRPCSKPGCPNLTTGRFCEQHQAEAEAQEAESNRFYDQYQRDQRAKNFYRSRAWKTARLRTLIRDKYLCQECLKEKRITQADTVHHRVELSKDWSRRLDLDNLVSLCAGCHNKMHSKG